MASPARSIPLSGRDIHYQIQFPSAECARCILNTRVNISSSRQIGVRDIAVVVVNS